MNAPLSSTNLAEMSGISNVSSKMVSLFDVSKTYPARKGGGSVAALRGVNLEIPAGAILGVIGKSGAGKSTLIRLVNGLERASSGKIEIAGQDVGGLDEAGWRTQRRSIGMIFQHFNLLSSRTAAQNIALPLEIAGAPRVEIAARVAELLDLVGLVDKADRYPAELSGGQKQRVGIARALATNPRVLLCDEATSALDPETTASILALLKRVNLELGVTILLITHEIPVIKEICDLVAVIEDGVIVEQGDVFSVLTEPRHPTTARFVENVTGIALPPHIAKAVTDKPPADGSTLLRIVFKGPNAVIPVVARLSVETGVEINILVGRLDAIAGQPFGTLIVSVPSDGQLVRSIIDRLAALDLQVKVIGHVS